MNVRGLQLARRRIALARTHWNIPPEGQQLQPSMPENQMVPSKIPLEPQEGPTNFNPVPGGERK